jgi:16S rRNA (adenine1518-N6/adenine1519-N6)-dimethyltransferase
MYTLKKSLGQHFLKDEQICVRIVDALKQQPFTRLLEVGPGGGALTKYLLQIPDITFRAVELDDEKVVYLLKTFPALKDKIIHHDFLTIGLPFDQPFTLVGNFPYNISTEILFKVLDWGPVVECVIGMFQKEVAQRIAAREGSKVYGVTSVLLQAYYAIEYLFDVPPVSFDPPPKVDSGVIRLLPLSEPPAFKSREAFFRLVKAAFGQRRKTLRNACRQLFEPEVLKRDIFDKRAEQLSVAQFLQLTFEMKD